MKRYILQRRKRYRIAKSKRLSLLPRICRSHCPDDELRKPVTRAKVSLYIHIPNINYSYDAQQRLMGKLLQLKTPALLHSDALHLHFRGRRERSKLSLSPLALYLNFWNEFFVSRASLFVVGYSKYVRLNNCGLPRIFAKFMLKFANFM